MRILTLNYEYPPLGGGGGVVHALIAEELARRHRVAVITSAFAELPRHEVRGGVEIYRVPVWQRHDLSAASLASLLSYPPAAVAQAERLLGRERFDLVHSHFAVPTGPAAVWVARRLRAPHVLSLHGGDIYDPSKPLSPHRVAPVRWTVAAVLRAADAVVAQSSNTRDNARRYYGFAGAITTIPLGIRQPGFASAPRAELGLPREVFLAVTVGRLVPRKRIDHLLRALARPECAAVHLAVVGAGPELEGLRALAAELGIAARVSFTGRVDEERKWQILAAADAYVSATMHEGFGLVYLEAMAAGLPVVTPDYGGQVDFLRDGETGYLVPAGDDGALAAAIARLQCDPTGAREIGQRNRARAVAHDITVCAEAYEQLFERLLHRPRNGASAPAGAA